MRHGTEKAKRPGGNRGVSETTSSEEIMAKRTPKSAIVKAMVGDTEISAADELAILLAEGRKKRQREWSELLAANPNVIEFPSSKRYRTVGEVHALQMAAADDPMARLASRICAKVDALEMA